MPRSPLAPTVLVTLSLFMGCATYERRPIELDAHLAAWRALGADDPRIHQRAGRDTEAFDPSDGLDLTEATLVALVLNPTARAARLRAEAVLAGVGLAGRWSDPALSTEVRRAIDTGASPWIVSAGLAITVPLSDRLAAQRDGAFAKASAARLEALLVEHDLRLAMSRAWLDWSLAGERARLLEQYLEALAPLVARAERLATAGELSGERLGVLQLEAADVRIRVAQANAIGRRRRERLLGIMGLTAAAAVTLRPTLDTGPPPARPPANWPERQTRIQQKLAEYEVSEQALRREVARQIPDLTVGAAFELDRGQSSLGLGLGLLPLPFFNRNRAGIAEATGRRAVVRALVEVALQQLVSDTEQLRTRSDESSRRLLALADLARRIDQQLARLVDLAARGELDVLVLRHVLERGLDVRLAVARTRRDRALAWARLSVLLTVQPEADPAPADGGAPR